VGDLPADGRPGLEHPRITANRWDTLRLAAATLLAGAAMGVIGALFVAALGRMDWLRLTLIDLASDQAFPGWLAAAIVGLLGAGGAAWLAQRFAPDAPQESPASSTEPPARPTAPFSALTVNFVGTSLALAAGLAVGPERPAIQMGGAGGRLTGRLLRLGKEDSDLLVAATGGAGVATMFNSPLGCAAYVVETVVKRVDLKTSLTALGAGAMAVGVSRLLTGRDVNFVVEAVALPGTHVAYLLPYLLVGLLIGVLAHLHSRAVKAMLGLVQRIALPRMACAGLIGAAVGLLAWYAPPLVGTGEAMVQGVIDGRLALSMLAVALAVRFFLGPLSLAAGTPGGYFTPTLLLGALAGVLLGDLTAMLLPGADLPSSTALAVVGMAVALAVVARAPFTGILLTLETTGAFILALPMIIAVFGAVAVSQMLRTPSLSHGLEASDAQSR
jgi:CIC family chloride channel protein